MPNIIKKYGGRIGKIKRIRTGHRGVVTRRIAEVKALLTPTEEGEELNPDKLKLAQLKLFERNTGNT